MRTSTPGRSGIHQQGRIALALLACLAFVGCLATAAPAGAATPTALVGTLQLTAGHCSGGAVTGTYLRMILPSGSPSGPYMSNSDSSCSDQSFTPLAPGTQGGLIIGSYQRQPSPPFDAKGDAQAGTVTAPAPFYGTAFATSTNSVDPQTKLAVPAPRVTVTGSTLSADLRAFAVTWNNQYFNQGSPKPDGTYPGNTRPATGTYDASSGAVTLTWTSQVVGGPFDKFTGQWHLQGRFVPSGNAAPAVAQPTSAAASTAAARPATAPPPAQSAGAAHPAQASPAARTIAAAAPAASGAAGSAPALAPAAATTTIVTKDRWHVTWWLAALALAVAVAGLGVLVALNRAGKGAKP